MTTGCTTTRPKALRRIGGVLVMLFALGSGLAVNAPAAEAAPSAATIARYEARVIWRINVVRAAHQRGSLRAASCPDRYAESWAAYLARNNAFRHQSMYKILRGCNAHVAAENLARGNVSADKIVAAWMASPGHRANIMDRRLTRVGVAAVYSRGQWTIAADFSRP